MRSDTRTKETIVNGPWDYLNEATGHVDSVLANLPFNANPFDKERLQDAVGPSRCFLFGKPKNYSIN